MGDLDFYSALSKEDVISAISRDIKKDNFKLISYELKAAGEHMIGFLGIHFKIYAQIEVLGETKNVQYFVKKMPMDIASHHDYAIKTRAYFKEIYFYKRVIEDIKNNLAPGRKMTKWCPEFYFAKGEEIFVLEDLSLQGYSMYPEREPLDLEHIHAAIKAIAGMHAGSLILDEKLKTGKTIIPPLGCTPGQPTKLSEVHSEILFESEATGETGHPGNRYYTAGTVSQLAIVDLLPGYTDEQKSKIKQRLPATLQKLFELVKPSTKYRNVWNHGDLWSNNVMFQKDASGKVGNVIFVDFQLARFAPPALDIIMFMHFVQTREFREKHLPAILDYYYSALAEELKAENLEIENVLPRKEFDESCGSSYETALITQVFHFQFILCPPRVTDKYLTTAEQFDRSMLVDRTEMITEAFLTDEICRTRFIEVMDEVIEFYHLAE